MNVLLLNPPFRGRFSRAARSPGVTRGGTIYYPIWLAYAAGGLERDGFQVRLVDAPAAGLSLERILAGLADFPPRLAVLDTSTPSLASDLRAAAEIKTRFPECAVVVVGTHVSALPEETLRASAAVDAVARREYDATVLDLARSIRNGGDASAVAGLSFSRDGAIVHNPDRPLLEDLDALPFVTEVFGRHLDVRDYYFAAARYPMVMTMTARGCPNRCGFCVYPQTFHGRRARFRSAENVVEEFAWIIRHLPGVREVGIEDDTFTADAGRAREICEGLLRRRVRIPWYANVRPDVDLETLRIMKRAGCRLVTVGFESGSPAVLEAMHKGLRTDQARRFAADARRAGLLVHGCLVFGYPGETPETIRESLRFARDLKSDSMQFYPFFAYPGTEGYALARSSGLLETEDYSKWVTADGYHDCVIRLPGGTSRELAAVCERAYRRYHLHPAYLWRKLRQGITRPAEGVRTIRSGWKYLASLGRRRRAGGRDGI
jgi:anaerobic magnesium-protoporphyrin IX monomethyl ester cyclase